MKLVRANKSDVIDKIEHTFKRLHDAYVKVEEIGGYIDTWEILEGKVRLIIGDYDEKEYAVEPFADIEMPFSPDFHGDKGVILNGQASPEVANHRAALALVLESRLDNPKYDDGNNLAFCIMMNALRFIPSPDEEKPSEDEEEE